MTKAMKFIEKMPYQFSGGANIVGGQTGYFASWGSYSARDGAESRFPKCRAIALNMNVTTNTLNSESTFEIIKNGEGTGIIVTYATEEIGRKRATGEVEIADGDLITIEGVLGGNGGQAIYLKEINGEFNGRVV